MFSNSKHAKGRELSVNKDDSGYLRVKMNNKSYKIHSLVANFILGERPKDYVVNHKDGVKTNNRPSNLEYVTIAENIRHIICNLVAKIIVKYFNTFALCIVNCSRFVQTKHK